MNSSSFSVAGALLFGILTPACAGENPTDPLLSAGAAGTAGGAGTGPMLVSLVPDESGWVDRRADGNSIGVQGAWYPYGDQYGEAKCTLVGLHSPEQCSSVSSPDPLVPGFPNQGGVMCTSGETAVVGPCKAGVPRCPEGSPDYSNMWGAGIGLDLNADGAPLGGGPTVKHPWNPDEHRVVGIAFEIDKVPSPGLRVEFPIVLPDATTTDNHPDGSPYWGAKPGYPDSNVVAGHNEFRFSEVAVPTSNYEFDRTKILAIQFHVPAITSGATRGAYEFCISKLSFVVE
jgi:hypothetical protein